VESAGDALVQRLLPQFESYLEPSAASRLGLAESRYDLVREGVVVLLGMMAGHLAPGDDKVRHTGKQRQHSSLQTGVMRCAVVAGRGGCAGRWCLSANVHPPALPFQLRPTVLSILTLLPI
jgi:hypothetical protein